MMYFFEDIMGIIYMLYNNTLGITIAIVTPIIGFLLCHFMNVKIVISTTLFCAFWLVLGILATIAQNSPDMLWMPVLFFPITIIMISVDIAYYIIKWAIKKLKAKRNK